MNIQQESFNLRFGAVDRSDRLTLAATFDFFQEAAINHAEALGVGRDAMVKTGQLWVLSRLSVIWDRRPRWRDPVTVRSWPRGWEKLFALRDYDIRDAAGVPVVRGRSCWIILDMEKRRPLRPQAVMETLPINEGLNAMDGVPPSLESRGDALRVGERRARYSDVDYNGHVNNARYVQWIQDLLDMETLENWGRARLDINYLGEVKPGQTVELWRTGFPAEEGWDWAAAFEGRRLDDTPDDGRNNGSPDGKRPHPAPAFRCELRIAAAPC
jgi:acyl-ACP thioesterase